MSDDELISTRTAARILGLSPRTLEAWRHRGRGPRCYRVGHAVKYRAGDVRRYLEQSVLVPGGGNRVNDREDVEGG